MKRLPFITCFLASAILFIPPAEAVSSITFTFDYYDVPPHTAPFALTGPGSFGTLTLTDSTTDPNRVDIHLEAIPHPAYAGAKFEQFYLNFVDPFVANRRFYLVPPNAVAGDISTTLGSVGYTNNNIKLANYFFDVNPNATSGALIFDGSLTLYNKLPNPDVALDLDVDMFNYLTTNATGRHPDPQMYAAYRLNNFNVNPNDPNFPDGEFWAFASSSTPVPVPSTLLLMGSGLAGLVGIARRRMRKVSTDRGRMWKIASQTMANKCRGCHP